MKRLASLLMLLMSLTLVAVSHTISYSYPNLTITEDSLSYNVIEYSNLSQTDIRSAPALPVEYLNFIIPTGTDVGSITISNSTQELVADTINVTPSVGPIYMIGEYQPASPDSTIYSSNDLYPLNSVEVVNHMYIGANRIVKLAIYPLQVKPQSEKLYINKSINFTLNTVSSTQLYFTQSKCHASYHESLTEKLELLVENDSDIPLYMNIPPIIEEDPGAEDFEMVIIGAAEYEDDFEEFIEWKNLKGCKTKYKSTETIALQYSGYPWGEHPISDLPSKIRAYLKNMWQSNCLRFAIIVGGGSDPDHHPTGTHLPDNTLNVRYSTREQNSWDSVEQPDWDDFARVSSDLYFADFGGDYDFDGDDYFGEYYSSYYQSDINDVDRIDLGREIAIGRVLITPQGSISEEAKIVSWVHKTLIYEQNPGYGDNLYLDNTIIENGYYLSNEDGWTSHVFLENEIDPTTGFDMESVLGNLFIEVDGTTLKAAGRGDATAGTPTGANTIQAFNNDLGWGLINQYCHGWKIATTNYSGSRNVTSGIRDGYYLTALDAQNVAYFGGNESINGYDNIVKTGKYSIMLSAACLTAHHDGVKHGDDMYPPNPLNPWFDEPSMAESWTCGTVDGGGPVYIGNVIPGTMVESQRSLNRTLYNFYTTNNLKLSESLAASLENAPNEIISNELVYFGDPDLDMWVGVPNEMNISHDFSNNSVIVTDATTSSPIENASVVFTSATGDYYYTHTNSSGVASHTVAFQDVCVTKYNYLPYISSIAAVNETISSQRELRYDLIVPSGRTLTVSADLELDSSAGKNARIIVASGATLVLSSSASIVGHAETYTPNGTTGIQVTIPGNSIEVYGTFNIYGDVNSLETQVYTGGVVHHYSTGSINNAPVGVYITGGSFMPHGGDFVDCDLAIDWETGTFGSLFGNTDCNGMLITTTESFGGIKPTGIHLPYDPDCPMSYSNLNFSNLNACIVNSPYTELLSPQPETFTLSTVNVHSCNRFLVNLNKRYNWELYNIVHLDDLDDGHSTSRSIFFSTGSVEADSCSISGVDYAFDFYHNASSTGTHTISNTLVDSCTVGILTQQASITLDTNSFRHNDTNIVAYSSTINASYGSTSDQGNNIFEAYSENIYIDSEMLNLKYGYNDFYNETKNHVFIQVDTTRTFDSCYDNYWEKCSYDNCTDKGINPYPDYVDGIGDLFDPFCKTSNNVSRTVVSTRFDRAISMINNGQMRVGCDSLGVIITENLSTEQDELLLALDAYFYTMLELSYNDTDYLENFIDGILNTSGLSSLWENALRYKKRLYVKNNEFTEALDIVDDFIEDATSVEDYLLACIDEQNVLMLMDEEEARGVKNSFLLCRSMEEYRVSIEEKKQELLEARTSINEDEVMILPYTNLYSNYPNPFNPTTTISFSIPQADKVNLSIYNIKGQKVKELASDNFAQGRHNLVWDGKDSNGKNASSGVYFYKIKTSHDKITKKMMLLK